MRRAFALLFDHGHPPEATCAALRNLVTSNYPNQTRGFGTAASWSAVEDAEPGRKPASKSDFEPEEPGVKGGRISKPMQWTIKKHLQYLDDPLDIARHVEQQLAKDRFEEAVNLVREASRRYKVAVSWNHLIEYQLHHHRLRAALKLFNEMKKRGQLPTAQTYTIIFKGCAESPHPRMAVTEAVKLYTNMLANPDERLKPNVVHMNAVLMVCAKAYDIESMFTILESANDGRRSPDLKTYTTIINALRAQVLNPGRDSDGPLEAKVEEAISRAQSIWDEIIKKWRKGDVAVDEELVCAMGRLLLEGDWNDNKAVLALIEQTMGIPKDPKELVALLKTPKATSRSSKSGLMMQSPEADGRSPKVVCSISRKLAVNPFLTHAKPGSNSLSLVLRSLTNTTATTLVGKYWDVFIKVYSVTPDAGAWYSLFTALGSGHNSKQTVEYLKSIPRNLMYPSIFRVAMRTCLRDNLNPSAFNNATQVLEIMLTGLRIPDTVTLLTYLRVAYANKRLHQEYAKNDLEGAKLAWGKQLSIAVANMWDPYRTIAKQFTFGGLGAISERKFLDERERERWAREAQPRADLAKLSRKIMATQDRLISDGMVPFEIVPKLKERNKALHRFLARYFEDRERYEPNWNRKVEELGCNEEDDEPGCYHKTEHLVHDSRKGENKKVKLDGDRCL